ncbi:hypothetical protein [Sphingomonas fuzhouensis]|uniref:hypothetical protein n=1 Tax=Sphingomonas fuzhouensis TaxID=3106033 RepID=UPI002AFECE3F|nr:hypothetical protein [Sphingomonas sp. SGZ-02]
MRRLAWPMLAVLTAAAPSPRERVVAPDGRADLSINGVTRVVMIDPGAPGMPIITKSFAEAAGMKPGIFSIVIGVGSTKIPGKTAIAEICLGDTAPYKRRVAFTEPRFAPGADGVFGPASLPDPVIRFQLHAVRPGEHTVILPMAGGGMFGDWSARSVVITVEGEPMQILFSPRSARTTTNAGGAVRLARAYNGQLTGAITKQEIAFGVTRPLRTLALKTPIAIGPFAMSQLGVRTTDFGSTATIADADAPGDPDEVVVTGKGKHNPKKDWLSIGADQLNRCSSIVFDKPAKQVRLSCL